MFSFKRSLKNRWIKYYQKSSWPIIVDIASVFTVIALLILFFSLYLYQPQIFIDANHQNKPQQDLPIYVLDLDNPPLKADFSFLDNYIDAQKPSSELSLSLENSSSQVIKDLEIKIISINPSFVVADLNLKTTGLDFEKTEANKLKIRQLESKAHKDLVLELNWSKLASSGQGADLKVDLEYLVAGQIVKKTLSLQSPRTESSIKVEATALYTSHDGDKLGLGPIPPIEQLPTNYWLFLEVENVGEIKDFIISSHLAKNVSLTDRYSLLNGDFKYDEENRLIVWKIDKMNIGDDNIVLGLEIQLIPDESQIGLSPKLLDDIKYSAKDPISGRELSAKLSAIDTNLINDKFNKNMGIVRSFSEY